MTTKTTLEGVEAAVNLGLNLVTELAPLADVGGPTAAAAGVLAANIASGLETVISAAENDATIIAGGDITKIKALQAQLQAANAAMQPQLDAS